MKLEGRIVAKNILDKIKRKLEKLRANVESLKMAVVYSVAEDSLAYLEVIKKRAIKLGIEILLIEEEQLADTAVKKLNLNRIPTLILKPLSDKSIKLLESKLNPDLDFDAVLFANFCRIIDENALYLPAPVEAVFEILDFYNFEFLGKHVLVIGKSRLIGKPIYFEMLKRGASVTMVCKGLADEKLCALFNAADLVVSAVGKKLFDASKLKEGAYLVDLGVTEPDFYSVDYFRINATPVPGGIGPVTTAVLFKNFVKCIERNFRGI